MWQGDTECNFCHTDVTKKKTFYDAKTVYGSWALMCPNCYRTHGRGKLGAGLGQQYDGKTKEKIK